jgi:Ca-activated chloride channel family protein
MRRIIVPAALVLLVAFGFGDLERGNRLYRQGRFQEAVEAYRAALADGEASPVLHYNLGTALLRLGQYDEAERHLRAALSTVEPDARVRAHFNLGNRFLEAARTIPDPRARAQLLDAAVEAYRQALRIDPGDLDAKWNLELALTERDQQPPVPQGGGEDQQDQDRQPQDQQDDGAGGGGGDNQPSGSTQDGGERRSRDTGALSPEQAERILSAVEQGERELQREKLRRGRRDTPVARDW